MRRDTITFQLATHFLPKIALRLESLFLTIEQACTETHPIIHHYALKNIDEILKLIEKPELKSRFLKEFMRIEHALNKSDTIISNTLYADLFLQIQQLSHVIGRFGEKINNNAFLQSLKTTQPLSQNDCELHSPQLLLWLESNAKKRQEDLISWLNKLSTLHDTVTIYLALLRNTAHFDTIDTPNGFYQRSLPSAASCHLILLRMHKNSGILPKMHIGHHGLSLRLYDASSMHDIRHTDALIDLAICQL